MSTPAPAEPMRISASQISDFEDCPRRWWLKRVARLQEIPKPYFTFGTVLHAVLERWLSADDQGRVPAPPVKDGMTQHVWDEGPLKGQKRGDPVDLYPPGWETTIEKGREESVSPVEQALIRKLVTQAIERGIIQRLPDRQVERKLQVPVIEGVELIGYIDLFLPGTIPEIQDHKTFSQAGARYLRQPGPADGSQITAPYEKGDGSSPNCIGHNQQVLTYAAASSKADGYHGPVVVRHNQFPKFKDPKGVRQIEAAVSAERVQQHWLYLQQLAAEMMRVRGTREWSDAPGPKTADACQRYGGCPFLEICGRRETIEGYSKRVERIINNRSAKRPVNLEPRAPRKKKVSNGGNTMDIFANLAKTKANREAAVAPAGPAVAVNGGAAPTAPAAPAEPASIAAGAPWANPKCVACGGAGVNSKGKPCPICDVTAKRNGQPVSSMYELSNDDEGMLVAVARPEREEELAALGAPEAWMQGVEPAPHHAPLPAPKPAAPAEAPAPVEEEPAEATAEPAAPEPAPAAKAQQLARAAAQVAQAKTPPKAATKAAESGRGRKKAGLTILLGAVQIQGPKRDIVLAQVLLEEVGAQVAKDMAAESYWDLEVWSRRKQVRKRAEAIAEELNLKQLVAAGPSDPDTENLVAALIPHATLVIEAVR